ncbi:MAG: hypothetical protein IJ412_12835, partial [Oscillospiraceae bacterium]|nr:hypothetical protein [Oscillospiraceae bacterium]
MSEVIKKAPETMTSKQRVRNTFAREKTDRVPIDVSFNEDIYRRTMRALGAKNNEELLEGLGVDFRAAGAPYTGPLLYPEKPGRNVDPVYGFYTRWVEHGSGGYHDFCDFPLKDADSETIFNFPVPSADDFDYDSAEAYMRAHADKALYVGNAGIADIINSIGRVMSMEDTLVNLMTEDEATLDLVDRKLDMELGQMERLLARCGDIVDFVWLGEDLG